MKVWMYVDQFATLDSSQEEEYQNLEELIQTALPFKISFKRNVLPHELKNGNPDIYIFDIGGLCYIDFSGDKRIDMSKTMLEQVNDHPNTLFIPYSKMTVDYVKFAMEDFLPELNSATNIFFAKSEWDIEDELTKFIRNWFA